MTDNAERALVIDAARRTQAQNLTHGTSGNVSRRIPSGMLITPTGMPYDLLEPADVVGVDLQGATFPGERRKPSSEWRIHAELYRARPDIGAIVHGHPPAASSNWCISTKALTSTRASRGLNLQMASGWWTFCPSWTS